MCSAKRKRLQAFHKPREMDSRGLTTLEFLGCLVALLGGAYLGAIYLGIDVKHLAYDALDESQLLDKVPAQLRPTPPLDKAMTREQLVTTLREELGSLRNQIAVLRTGKTDGATADPAAAAADAEAQLPTKERTLAYWTRLNEIALGEADLQRDAESAFSTPNAAKVFAVKGRICRFAAKAVEAVPTQSVDDEALRFGRQLGLWYTRGGELYERAVRIWETSTGPEARKQLTDEWHRADEQHRNEAKLVTQKATTVRGTISRIYQFEFPEFAKPAAATENNAASPENAPAAAPNG